MSEIEYIDTIELEKMPMDQLEKEARKMIREANSRIRQLQRAKKQGMFQITPPALKEHGTMFRQVPKGLELRDKMKIVAMYNKAKNFTQLQTSTIEGAINFQNELIKNLGLEDVADVVSDNFLNYLDKITDKYPEINNNKAVKSDVKQKLVDYFRECQRMGVNPNANHVYKIARDVLKAYEEEREEAERELDTALFGNEM